MKKIISNDNEDNCEIEIIRNCTFNIEGNILDNLIQKQTCDNILKAKRRHKKEKEKEKVEKRLELNFRGLKELFNLISEYHSVINTFTKI